MSSYGVIIPLDRLSETEFENEIEVVTYLIQQLPNSSRLRGVWGDPDVHDLTPACTRHIERPVPTGPQKTFFDKKI